MKKNKTSIAKILSFESNETELRNQLSNENTDWDWFVEASSHLGVMTTAYCRLKQKGLLDLVPKDLNAYLSEITKINRHRNESLLNQVRELSKLFNDYKINHVFVKGCALLASGCYTDFGERLIGDIDVLVEPTNLYKAEQLLLNLEYVSSKPSLFGKYKKHRHLPRLVHPNRLGAVEIHSKLLRKNSSKILNLHEIIKNRNRISQVYVPKTEVNMDILILNHQINDFGYLFKCINFKTCYDSLILEQQMNQPRNTSNDSKYHRVFFTLRNTYFESPHKDFINRNIPVVKNFYKHINKNGVLAQIYRKLVNINIGLITCIEGLKLFIRNKDFRSDLWNHRSEAVKLLKGDK